MKYVRKTRDEYEIYANYGYGLDLETTEDNFKDAKKRLRELKENCKDILVDVKIIKRRIKL